ncbi:MAG: class I SAM-dependent methyltransferase [Gemmataceae bacterium]|nr:class I SAM-dependent methyltransferase [Gemmataceae bacterium]
MVEPRISFVVPCHNGSQYLDDCVRSLQAQEVPCEMILVDDQSTDDSYERARKRAVESAMPILVVSQKNAGPAAARNVGLRTASAPYVCFLDVDDRPLPNFASAILGHLDANPGLVAIYSHIELVNSHRPVADWQKDAIENSIPSNLVVRTDIARRIGGFPVHPAFRGRAAGEDILFREQLEIWGKVARVNLVLLQHTIRPGSHFDYFMDRATFQDGKIIINESSKEELDGSLERARAEYKQLVGRRTVDHVLDQLRAELPASAKFLEMAQRFESVQGFLNPLEGFALYWLASRWPIDGATVEIGSFKGRSTCWIATGCKEQGKSKLTAVDPFTGSPEHQAGGSHPDPDIIRTGSTLQVFQHNIQRHQLNDWVIPRVGRSADAVLGWNERIRMLFIDGDHSYEETARDFHTWTPFVGNYGIVAFHDVNTWPGVTQFFNELGRYPGQWKPLGVFQTVGLIVKLP